MQRRDLLAMLFLFQQKFEIFHFVVSREFHGSEASFFGMVKIAFLAGTMNTIVYILKVILEMVS